MRSMKRGVLIVVLVGLALVACGRRGPLVAPERRLPAAVQDLAVAVEGPAAVLTWTLPTKRVDGSPLKDLARLDVFRREEPGEGPPRPAVASGRGVAGFERVAAVRVEEPAPARVEGGRATVTDAEGIEFGRRYTYVVLSVDARGRMSPPSNRATVAFLAAPRPPEGLRATAGDREVRLAWQPPATLEDGSPVPGPLVYQVFRSDSPDRPATRPLNPEPLTSLSFTDLGVRNDVTYVYTVRALLGPGGPVGRASEAVQATPEDLTPPAAPRNLSAVAAPAAILLAWAAGTEPDLAGYHVYRSTAPGRGYERLTAAPQSEITYQDTAVTKGRTYHYVVTAVDRSRRANESVPSSEASATVR